MRDVEVLEAAAVDVGGVDGHACFVAAVFAGGDAGDEGDVFEGAVVIVEEKKIGPGVVGDGDVGPAVAVEIGENDAHAFCFGLADAGGIADVGEGTVVIVVVELQFLAAIVAGIAVGAIAGTFLAAPEIVFGRPVDVIENDEIEIAVVVVIEPGGAGGPAAFVGDTSFCGDIGEGTVAVVVIKDGAVVAGDVEVGKAVVIVIGDGDSLAVVIFRGDAGLIGDIGECSVTVVVIERGTERVIGLVKIGGAGLDEIEVHEAVLIVVESGDAGAHGFKIELFFGLGGVLEKGDAGLFANVGEADGGGRGGFFLGFSRARRAGDLWDEKKRDERCEAREILGGGKVCGHRVRSARERAICRNCWRAGMGRGCSGAAAAVWGALGRACSIRLTSRTAEEWM